jgi:nucleotide-binding universal stress UspA family protein
MYDTILVPTDGGESAVAAVGHALEIAAHFDAAVRFLSVVDSRTVGLVTPGDVDAVGPEYREESERSEAAVAAAATAAESTGVLATTAVEVGLPHRAIVEHASDHDVDLVVMGTSGRRGLERALHGSVAEQVVRSAEAPVLTVHG